MKLRMSKQWQANTTKDRKYTRKIVPVVTWAIFSVFFFCFYMHFLGEYRVRGGAEDIYNHIYSSLAMFHSAGRGIDGLREFKVANPYSQILSYPVWHILWYSLYRLIDTVFPFISTTIAIDVAASTLNAALISGTGFLIYIELCKDEDTNLSWRCGLLISIALMFVGPFDASSDLGRYYLGAYSGNLWHNPTYLMVRPIALLVFICYSRILSERKVAGAKYYIAASLLLLLSALCKPSFYQSFLPGLVLYCVCFFLIRRDLDTFLRCLKVAATCVPVTLLALLQYGVSISGEGGAGIGVSFLYVWTHYTEHWFLSLLVSIVFPLAVYLATRFFCHRLENDMLLALCFFLSAVVQYMLFYIVSGPFAGDFSWSVGLSIFIGFYASAKKLLSITVSNSDMLIQKVTAGCWTLFAVHTAYGILYVYHIWIWLAVTNRVI